MLTSFRAEFGRRVSSFRYAFAGWRYLLQTQRNSWIHLTLTFLAFALALWLKLPRRDWAILLLTMMAVWIAELMNTAIEAIVDMVMPSPHPLAKVAKDVAAAAVLTGAIGAVLIGLLLFGPPLWQRVFG